MELTPAQLAAYLNGTQSAALRACLHRARLASLAISAHVDAYTRPIFDAAGFPAEITGPDKVWQCEDDAKCATYYAACNAAHRANGYGLPDEHCPAHTAEHAVAKIEWEILEAAHAAGLPDFRHTHGATRAKVLELLTAPIVGREKDAERYAAAQALTAAAALPIVVPVEVAAPLLAQSDRPWDACKAPGVVWAATNEARYWDALECLPPVAMAGGAFLMGEAADHTLRDEAVYSGFWQVGGAYFHRFATVRQFRAWNDARRAAAAVAA